MKSVFYKTRKTISFAIVFAMVLSLFPNNLNVYAAETDVGIEETSEEPTSEVIEEVSESPEVEETTTEEITEETTEAPSEPVAAPVPVESEATTEVTTEASTEEVTEEVTEETTEEPEVIYEEAELIPTFDHLYEGVDVSGKDFSSCELLIATGDSSIFTADTEVVSEYDGIYLTRYPDATQTMYAYSYYYTKANLVLVNSATFKVADEVGENIPSEDTEEGTDDGDVPQQSETEETSDENVIVVPAEPLPNDGHGEADLSGLNTGDDAFSQINNMPASNYSGYIALIDSGASGADASVSVLGGGAGDDNGHGTRMANKIREIYPGASILSIKALDSSGRGQASDIYAAIQYAINANVKIINLSIASINSSDSRIVVDAINEAIANGITVVGAAGNYGSDASYFIPGCVGGVITCTATDENGVRLSNSNYGSAVDYYVVSNSSSEAAATVSALIARDGLDFESDLVRTEEGSEEVVEETTEEASVGDASETDAEEEDKATEEARELNNQANLNEHLKDLFPWLGGTFAAQAPAGYPNSFTADVWFNQTTDHANADGVIGYLVDWNVRSININQYDYVAGSQAVYCGCVSRGVANVSHSYSNTGGGHTHYSGPAGAEHLCITPGAQAGNWNRLQISNTTFVYVDQITYNGLSYARYKTTDGVDQFLDTAGVQYVDIYVYLRLTEQPGFVSLHKQATNPEGTAFSGTAPSMDGIVYGLYDDEHLDSAGNNKIAEFTLGANGYPKSIRVTSGRAGSSDGQITGDDGHLYLKWVSAVTPQNWYFKEISANANYLVSSDEIPVQYGWDTKNVVVKDVVASSYIRVTKKSSDSTYKSNLSGAEFKVFDTQPKAQAALTSKNYSQAIGTLTVPTANNSTGLTNTLDVSNYMNGAATKDFYIVESKAPSNYLPSPVVHTIQAKLGTTPTNPVNLDINEQTKVHMYLEKSSANPSCTNRNPNYSLENAVYRIFTTRQDAADAMASGDWSKALKNGSGEIINLRTGSDGVSNKVDMSEYMQKNANGTIRNTQFFLAEYRAPKNYKMNNVPKAVTVTTENDVNAPAVAEVSDTPVDDPVNITVVKQYKDGTKPLSGAKFTVKFYAQLIEENYTFEQLSAMRANWSKDFTTGTDGKTDITYDGNYFPLGYITIEEVEAPEGFKIDGSVTTINNTQISNKIAAVTVPSGNASVGYNMGDVVIVNDDGTRGEVLRNAQVSNPIIVGDDEGSADIEVQKECGDDGTPIEAATFEVKNNDTGEIHTFKTDDKGYYSSHSSYVSHSAPNGIWFVNGPQGIVREVPDDDKGALTLGNYTVTEIDAQGHQKEEPITFDVTEDGEIYTLCDDGRGDGLKVISDMEIPTLGTLALVELFADGSSPSDEEYEEIMKNFDGTADSLPEGTYKVLPATEGQKITDVCHYKNLRFDTDYTLYGRLMQIGKDGSVTPFKSGGKEVTGITNFHTPETYEKSQYDSCGYATVRFTNLDFTDIQDTSFVVFESLYIGNLTEEDITSGSFDTSYVGLNNDTVTFPINHEDASDKNQTVTTPTGITQALSEDGTKTVSVLNKHFVIYDTCSYKGLIKGRTYEITGYVYEKPLNPKKKYTEDELKALRAKDKNGEYITGSTTFTAEKSEGSVVVKFEFDMDYKVQKKSYVVGEECYDKDSGNVLVFTHEDISDHDQSFYEPVISTQAKGTEERSELCYNEGKFIDTIHYENLEPNASYTVEGVAMDKETGKELTLNGKPVKATATFTTGDATNPNSSVDGDYDLEFTISEDQFEDLEGKTLVVFETLKNAGGTVIAKHEDIDDEGQQLTVPKIKTTLVGEKSKTHVAFPDEQTTLIDTCKYENLIPGKSYSMHGVLMNKSTEEPLKDENGKVVESTTEFVADESGSGIVEVKFTFNAKILKMEGESVVAFEDCTPSDGTIPVGVHMDINDKDQEVDFPKVGTKVSKSSWTSKETISLTDSISYKNLMVEEGYKYIAKGWLVDQNGNKVVVDGKEVYKEVEFTPTAKDGMVDVKFDDFSAATLSGKYVVYEEVYVVVPEHKDENGKTVTSSTALVGEHKDLSDTNQTITVSGYPKTGMTMFFVILGLMVMGGIGMLYAGTRKKETEDVIDN